MGDPRDRAAATVGKPVPFRGGGFRPRPMRIVAPLAFVVLIALWEWGSATGVISQLVLPAPSEAFEAFRQLIETGLLWKHLGPSLQRIVIVWIAGPLMGGTVGRLHGVELGRR